MRFHVRSKLTYEIQEATPFVFNVEAQKFGGQAVEGERLALTPGLPTDTWTMPESGNRYFRGMVPAGSFALEYEADVELTYVLEDPAAVRELTPADLPLYPSRYCQSDQLERFARSTFGGCTPGYSRVNEICNWIHDYVEYEGGVSDALTSAFDTVTQRAGVCRDFAHLAIALCRTMAIPARYISAYAFRLDPPDFHAVFEAFLQGPEGPGWYIFDPTRMSDPTGLVRIGVGRDAADVAFATPYGPCDFGKPEVSITADQDLPRATTLAVRTELLSA